MNAGLKKNTGVSMRHVWLVSHGSTDPKERHETSRPVAARGRLRFTGPPASRDPRFVCRSVSGTRSTEKGWSSRDVTVRQAPLTLMLPPGARSAITLAADMVESV